MPGTKNHSGGKRKNAGRPPKTLRIRDGQQVGLWQHGVYTDALYTVEITKRGTAILTNESGEKITLVNN